MILSIHSKTPESRKIKKAVEVLKSGGVIIYPTDTVYALGCSIEQKNAIEQICRMKQINPKKVPLSFICQDMSQAAQYLRPLSNNLYKLMRKTLPGPYTYILRANNKVPKMFKNNKKTVGVRIPNHNIVQALLEELGHPILSSSLKDEEEYLQDPLDITELYEKRVDLIINGGWGGIEPSTIIDATTENFEVTRFGAGELDVF